MLGFDVRPQHTWSVLELLLGINDRDQELVLHEKRDTRRETSAETPERRGAHDAQGLLLRRVGKASSLSYV